MVSNTSTQKGCNETPYRGVLASLFFDWGENDEKIERMSEGEKRDGVKKENKMKEHAQAPHLLAVC